MIRLKDIAAEARVSVMTVSKALRNAKDISANTKARIRALADAMGYTPDSVAQGLRNRNTKLFGLVLSAVTNPMFARVVMGIEEKANEHGYDVILVQTLNIPEREHAVIRRLLSRRVEGIFISPVYRLEPTAPVYEELRRRGTPVVVLGHKAPFCQGFVNVETDDIHASQAVTRHLIELGHRRIAFLAGTPTVPSFIERLEGYRRALREAGLEVDDRLVFGAGSSIEDGEKAALELLQERPGATAVQAVNDMVAIGAGNVFLSQGLQIPRDLSLAGFGNVLVSEHYRVPLTTVRQPKLRLGTAAIDSMFRLLSGTRPESKRLPGEIVARQSTGPPAGAEPVI
jgi:DNA-binding LacI/PurR family transcriptional regulator